MKSLERKELILLALQFVGIISLFLFSKLFWLLFILNIGLLSVSIFGIFDVKPTVEAIKKNIIYISMPILYFLGVIFFMTAIKNIVLQVLILGAYVISNHYFINHIASIKEKNEECSTSSRNIVTMLLLVTMFLITSDLINAYIFFKLPLFLILVLIFSSTWLITRFLFTQYNISDKKVNLHVFFASFGVMQLTWLGSFWLVNYPRSKIGELGIPLIAIISLVCYYTFWGLSNHKLTNTLTKKVLTEYIMISVIIILILLFTTKWIPQGVIS